jgi:hypothetical protein
MLREERSVRWDGADLSARFGVPPAERAVVVPMVIKDKISAVVYVDAVEADVERFDEAAIELLVFTTGLLIDTLAIRKRLSPTLSGAEGQTPVRDAAPAAAPAPAPATAASAPAPAQRPAPTPQPASPAADSTVAISPQQIRQMMGGPAAVQPRTSPPPQTAPTPAPAAPPAPAAAPTPAAHGHGEDRPSTQFVPPAGVNRGGASPGAQDDEAKRHDEARRFARLLVSEIKLYNESKVDQGRKNRDLYDRMKDDIDRSRQMFDERISEDVRKVSNYFYDELVRILADGNADALGL